MTTMQSSEQKNNQMRFYRFFTKRNVNSKIEQEEVEFIQTEEETKCWECYSNAIYKNESEKFKIEQKLFEFIQTEEDSCKKKNKLEWYLNNIYENKCEIKIYQEEVEFIQTGIETLVQDLVDKILADGAFDKLISDSIDKDSYLTEEMYKEKSLVEVYFPILSDCSLQRYVAENASNVQTVKSTIIKVGSFYDGTKNNFPDEFDFIFLLLGFTKLTFSHRKFPLDSYFYQAIYNVCGKSLHYPLQSENYRVTKKLDFEKFIGKHGPACKLLFTYRNESGEQRPIHVDLVPAVKIIDSKSQQWFVEKVSELVEPETFREEILSAESCLTVQGNLAFTEIEQHFMKNILSKRHVKVYRILKYLVNGHGDDEECKKRSIPIWYYTSYRIKTLMIYHHESCTNTDTEDLGPCVLQVLQEISTYNHPSKFPNFNGAAVAGAELSLLPDLNSTITTLQSMQTSEKSYNSRVPTYYDYCVEPSNYYEIYNNEIKSVTRQYLDRELRYLDRNTGDLDRNTLDLDRKRNAGDLDRKRNTGDLDRQTRPCCVIL